MSAPDGFILDVTVPSPPPPELAGLPLPARIAVLRRQSLRGISVVFRPYERAHGEALRALRNLPHNKANLAQSADITPEQQRGWEDAYFARPDDLCWTLFTPAGEFAGSVSLYDIAPALAETGRLVIREDIARATPIIAETELMIQHLAFAWLGLAHVAARIQPANAKMVTMHERLGFRVTGPDEIRGVPYLRLEIAADGFRPGPHAKVLRHWRTRAVSPNLSTPT